jgi:hypothetical protein
VPEWYPDQKSPRTSTLDHVRAVLVAHREFMEEIEADLRKRSSKSSKKD